MHPILFTIPVIDFPIYTFAVLTLASVMLSLQYISYESKRRGLDAENNVNFAIEVDGRYVGGCGLINLDHVHRRAEIGIFVGDKSIWGRGVGSEAMALVMGYGFDYLNLHRIFLRVFAENTRAIHVYESLGFQHEGRFRDTEWRHGRWHDMLYMSVLETEWRQRSAGKVAD